MEGEGEELWLGDFVGNSVPAMEGAGEEVKGREGAGLSVGGEEGVWETARDRLGLRVLVMEVVGVGIRGPRVVLAVTVRVIGGRVMLGVPPMLEGEAERVGTAGFVWEGVTDEVLEGVPEGETDPVRELDGDPDGVMVLEEVMVMVGVGDCVSAMGLRVMVGERDGVEVPEGVPVGDEDRVGDRVGDMGLLDRDGVMLGELDLVGVMVGVLDLDPVGEGVTCPPQCWRKPVKMSSQKKKCMFE